MDIQQQTHTTQKPLLFGLGLIVLLILTYLLYSPGLSGIFIFDDTPNLSPMGKYSEYSYWERLWLFLLQGNSGPTGRPISLVTFFLNDPTWPSRQPGRFVATNILIHLFNGVLIFWISFKLAKVTQLVDSKKLGFALLTTSLWLLHPMHLTSVLYIIQRMTELSALFMLAGILFYLCGRESLAIKPIRGLVTLYIGTGLSLVLAILSKENGILMVAYIMTIEFFLLRPFKQHPPKNFNFWFIPAVVIPFISIVVYLGLKTDPNSFTNRDFTLEERVLTQPRILFEYLYQILIPNMGELTLFHDDYIISKNWLDPWTTTPSIVGIIALIVAAFFLKKKSPVLAFGIAWFFAGHLIESTVLPLELYFEHRNYLPLLGVSIAIAYYAYIFYSNHKPIVLAIMGVTLLLFSFITFQNANLWGKPIELGVIWYQNNPHSIRSKQNYLNLVKYHGVPANLVNHKKVEEKKSMLYTSLVLNKLADKCSTNSVTNEDLNQVVSVLNKNIIHISSPIGFEGFMENWKLKKCPNILDDDIEAFLISLSKLKNIQKNHYFAYYVHYWLGGFYQSQNNLSKTIHNLVEAYKYRPNLDMLMLRAEILVSDGQYKEALKALNDTSLLENSFRKKLAIRIKQKELNSLKQLIRSKLVKSK